MSPVEVSVDEIAGLAAKAGLKLEEGHAEDYSIMTTEFENLVASLGDDKLLFPRPDLTKYPRENVHVPEPKDTDGGGWATMVSTKDNTVALAIAESRVRPRSRQSRRKQTSWAVRPSLSRTTPPWQAYGVRMVQPRSIGLPSTMPPLLLVSWMPAV